MGKVSINKGFTLIEILVVITIIGVIAAIAIPMYSKYVEDARIEQAKAALMQNAQFMERWYIDQGSYTASGITRTLPNVVNEFYTFTLDASSTDSTYVIKATPIAAKNPATGYLKVDQDGNLQKCTDANVCTKL